MRWRERMREYNESNVELAIIASTDGGTSAPLPTHLVRKTLPKKQASFPSLKSNHSLHRLGEGDRYAVEGAYERV